ncbi:MAG: hypothetical protein KAS32_14490, partial [Candidatus Peribacteraceae bacterium]|nr:hypothetical protein [Candidatus Peribacteraceae bacterium]
MNCLICNKEFTHQRGLSNHIKEHGITAKEYKDVFNLHPECSVCGIRVSRKSKGYCNKCRPRSGKDNPFYGKKHDQKTMDGIVTKSSKTMKKKWKNPSYRKLVKERTTGIKRSDEFKKTQRINAIKQFGDVNQRLIRSKVMKQSWSNGRIPTSPNTIINRSKNELEIYNAIRKGVDVAVSNDTIHIGDRWFFPDILIDNKVVVEYYGDYWHANPLQYDSDMIIEQNKMMACDI